MVSRLAPLASLSACIVGVPVISSQATPRTAAAPASQSFIAPDADGAAISIECADGGSGAATGS